MYVHASEAVIGFLLAKVYRGLNLGTSFLWLLNIFVNGVFAMRFLIWTGDDDDDVDDKRKTR